MIILFSFLCYEKENPERVKNFLTIFRRKSIKYIIFFKENYLQSEYASMKRAEGAK